MYLHDILYDSCLWLSVYLHDILYDSCLRLSVYLHDILYDSCLRLSVYLHDILYDSCLWLSVYLHDILYDNCSVGKDSLGAIDLSLMIVDFEVRAYEAVRLLFALIIVSIIQEKVDLLSMYYEYAFISQQSMRIYQAFNEL